MYYVSKVREFHELFDPRNAPSRPGLPGSLTPRTLEVRLQLITEEFSELCHGAAAEDLVECLDALTDLEYVVCGTIVVTGADRTGNAQMLPSYEQQGFGPPRIPPAPLFLQLSADFLMMVGGLSQALATGDWQAIGGAALLVRQRLAYLWAAFRVPEELRRALFDEVHRSNMTKVGEDGKPVVSSAGRVVKGPNYQEPQLALVLNEHFPQQPTTDAAQ